MLSMWSEAELRDALLQLATLGGLVAGAVFVLDLAASVARRCGATPGPVVTALERRSPAPLRHLAELAVTALLSIPAARPASASPTPIRDWISQTATTTSTTPSPPRRPAAPATTVPRPTSNPDPAPRPEPPRALAPTPAPAPGPVPVPPPGPVVKYVVQRGDCLWSIAARRLGPGATSPAIDAAWRSIYAANRAAIGDDPNLIHPGLTLTLPPLSATP